MTDPSDLSARQAGRRRVPLPSRPQADPPAMGDEPRMPLGFPDPAALADPPAIDDPGPIDDPGSLDDPPAISDP